MSTILDQHAFAATVAPLGLGLEVIDATITLDEGWSPYAQARLTCKLPTASEQDRLDLRETALRLDVRTRQDFASPWALSTLTAAVGGRMADLTTEFGGKQLSSFYQEFSRPWNTFGRRPSTSRRSDLLITSRHFDHRNSTLVLVAESDEVMLHSDALVATSSLNPGTTSVRDLAQFVLDRIGAHLQPGDADGTVEADSTIWTPGVTAWDYIAPLVQSANLRLWCDERRRWWLTGVHPTSPGSLILTPLVGITDLTDNMQVTGDIWFDAVLITYRWTDAFDLAQVAYDAAGPAQPRNVYTLEYETPFPGPGAAAGILNRAQGRGRVLDVRAVSDYSAQPGQAASIAPPDTDVQTGYVSAVTWSWPDREMTVATRGLVDTPPESWLFAPAGVTWASIPPGVTWANYDPELIGA